MTLPVVDLSLAASDASGVADQIDRAARDDGFFLVVGHGVPVDSALWRSLPPEPRRLLTLYDLAPPQRQRPR